MDEKQKNEEIIRKHENEEELNWDEKKGIHDAFENDLLALMHGTAITIEKLYEFDDKHYACLIKKIVSPIKDEIKQAGLEEGVKIKLTKKVDQEQQNEDGTISIIF